MEKFSLSFHKFTLKGARWCWVPRNLKQDAVTFFSSILLCTLIFCIFGIPFRISVHYVTYLKNFFFWQQIQMWECCCKCIWGNWLSNTKYDNYTIQIKPNSLLPQTYLNMCYLKWQCHWVMSCNSCPLIEYKDWL